MTALFCIFLLQLTSLAAAAASGVYVTDYLTSPGYKSNLTTVLYLTGSSKIDCAATCSRMSWCMGVNYQVAARECHLLDADTVSTLVASDWVFICCGCQEFRSVLRDTDPDLLGFWPLTAQFQGRDIGPLQNNFQFTNVSFSTSPCWSQFSTVNFHGYRDSYAVVPAAPGLELPTSAFTWLAFVKPVLDGPLFAFNHTGSGSMDLGLHIWSAWGGVFTKMVDKDTGGRPAYRTDVTNPLVMGQWNRVGVAYDGATGTIYTIVNDNLDFKTDPGYVNLMPSTFGNLYIGSRYFDGSLDDRNLVGSIACVRFYKKFIDLTTVDIRDPKCAYTIDWTV